jgi:hypothetical protein
VLNFFSLFSSFPPESRPFVIPAQAGIQLSLSSLP